MLEGIGNRFKTIRQSLNLSQAKFSEKTNSSQKSISRYETEETPPDIGFIIALIDLYNIDPYWLITGKGEMYRYPENEIDLFKSLREDNDLHSIVTAIQSDQVIKSVLSVILTQQRDDKEIARQLNILRAALKK